MRPLLISCVALCFACGGSRPTSPTATGTPAAINQPPRIVSATISPGMGVSQVSRFTARVDAVDPDGDPVTVAWTSADRKITSQEREFTFVPGPGMGSLGIAALTVTVSDGKGASVSSVVDFVAAALDWEFDGWAGAPGHGFDFRLSLTQEGDVITGRLNDYRGHIGVTDPAEPGRIDADGRFRIRFKLASGPDTILSGQLVPYQAGTFPFAPFARFMVTGRVSGGMFDGQSFTFGYHDSY